MLYRRAVCRERRQHRRVRAFLVTDPVMRFREDLMTWKGVITFFVGGVAGFLLSHAAQSMIDAGAASKMKHSVGNAMTLSAALEKFRDDNGRYPSPLTREQLVQSLTP